MNYIPDLYNDFSGFSIGTPKNVIPKVDSYNSLNALLQHSIATPFGHGNINNI